MPAVEPMTVRAVVVYAAQLRVRAERDRAADPYANPYAPSEAAARKAYNRAQADIVRANNAIGVTQNAAEVAALAAERTIRDLAARTVMAERASREAHEASDRAERRHARRQKMARAEEQARLAGLSHGARLDRAVRRLGMFSETPAARLDADRVTGTPNHAAPTLDPDRYGRLLDDVRHLIFRLEEEVEHAQRRRIQEPRR